MSTQLPIHVLEVQKSLFRDNSHDLYQISTKLISTDPKVVNMWYSLEKHSDTRDNLWVWGFLSSAENYNNMPRYHYLNGTEKHELSDSIIGLAGQLAKKLTYWGLDGHLVHNDGINYNGFYVLEDFSGHMQAQFEEAKAKKLKVSKLITKFAERAARQIRQEPLPGKKGKKAKAVRFIRLLAARNKRMYKKPLNYVVATAANAIFGTEYVESDVRNLLTRAKDLGKTKE